MLASSRALASVRLARPSARLLAAAPRWSSTNSNPDDDILLERGEDGFATVVLNREKMHNTVS